MMESSDLPNGHNIKDVDGVVTTKTKTVGDCKSETPVNYETVSSTKLAEKEEISEKPSENSSIDNEGLGNGDQTNNTGEGLSNDVDKIDDVAEGGKGDGVKEESNDNFKAEKEDLTCDSKQDDASFKMEFSHSSAHPEDDHLGNQKVPEETGVKKKTKDEEEDSLIEKSDDQSDAINSENDASITVAESTSASYPECHTSDVHSAVTDWASNIRKQLDDIIALKTRRDVETSLSRLRKQLTEFEAATANDSCPLIYPGGGGASVKKRKVRSGSASVTTTSPFSAKNLGDNNAVNDNAAEESPPPPPKVDFKSLKGLAVFAKWPNSCWHYPGIVEGLEDLNAWKETLNVTVTFYDGLQRTMKNMNILPAALIPVGAILSDLEDETELLVEGKNAMETHIVDFDLKPKPDAETIKAPFSRLAIRAVHMKKIKSLLEPNFDVAPKKMHMVSLDNLVSGRRSRIRPSKDEEENTVDVTPRRGTRKSKRKSTGDEEESLEMELESSETSEAATEEPKPSPSKRRVK